MQAKHSLLENRLTELIDNASKSSYGTIVDDLVMRCEPVIGWENMPITELVCLNYSEDSV